MSTMVEAVRHQVEKAGDPAKLVSGLVGSVYWRPTSYLAHQLARLPGQWPPCTRATTLYYCSHYTRASPCTTCWMV